MFLYLSTELHEIVNIYLYKCILVSLFLLHIVLIYGNIKKKKLNR